MARGPAVKIILGDSERSELEMRARRRKIARVDAVRAEIVLLAAEGMNNCAIAATLGLSRRHRAQEFRKFLDEIARAIAAARGASSVKVSSSKKNSFTCGRPERLSPISFRGKKPLGLLFVRRLWFWLLSLYAGFCHTVSRPRGGR
jgi:hypothetical protein